MSDNKAGTFELVLDESIRAEDKIPYRKLKVALEDQNITEIVLVFIGVKHLLEDSVLLLRSMLMNRRPGVILTAKVLSSLATPDLLLYLIADHRFIVNPDVHFWFRSSDSAPATIEEEMALLGMEPCRKANFRTMDRQRVRELVSEYVDLEDLKDKMLSGEDMAELGLVNGCSIDNLLESLGTVPIQGSRGKI